MEISTSLALGCRWLTRGHPIAACGGAGNSGCYLPEVAKGTPTTKRSRPLADGIVVEVRNAITTGEYEPGMQLREERLAETFGVSRVPIREALRRLASEGFVVVEPNHGASVAVHDNRSARELLEVRSALETLIARSAAQHRTGEQVERLHSIVSAGRAAVDAGDDADVVRLNTEFHTQLAEAAQNEIAAGLVDQLRTRIEWVYSGRLQTRASESWAEHAAIVQAVEASDADAAAALTAQHLANASTVYQCSGDEDSG